MSSQADLSPQRQPARLPALVSRLPALVRRSGAPARAPVLYTEFLPAHLEILERPASPKMGALLWTICGMLTAAIIWGSIAKRNHLMSH